MGVIAGLILGVLIGFVGADGADRVRLRGVALVDSGVVVRLADVASIEGPNADRLAGVVVSGGGGGTTIGVRDVERALKGESWINWGGLLLSGAECRVVVKEAIEAPEPGAAKGSTGKESTSRVASDNVMVRAIALQLARLVGVEDDGVRIEVDQMPTELARVSLEGRTMTVQPMGQSERMSLVVRVYERDRVVATGTVRGRVLVRRSVAVARQTMERGHEIQGDEVAIEERWVGIAESPVESSMAAGSVVRSRVGTGEVISSRAVETPIVVRKGESVAVDCLSGSFVVRVTAVALGAGREGDVIECKTPGAKEPIRARVAGRGHVVVEVAPELSAAALETNR
ncbi:MAG: flagellar basal body P-ring formation protein FlgA [Phycisphaerales bacterium]|nr:MAG: flagellar basal body P-ring formation protein FlgA [Phycisphaerales bacterium]